jgi:hypothetical protein
MRQEFEEILRAADALSIEACPAMLRREHARDAAERSLTGVVRSLVGRSDGGRARQSGLDS